jgi:hypothetical protein
MEPDVILTKKLRSKLANLREHDNLSTQSKEIQDVLSKEETKSIPFRLVKYAYERHQCHSQVKGTSVIVCI